MKFEISYDSIEDINLEILFLKKFIKSLYKEMEKEHQRPRNMFEKDMLRRKQIEDRDEQEMTKNYKNKKE